VLFDGYIAGLGTASGTRLVLGHWLRSPYGPVSDVMIEFVDGRRVLLAPSRGLADFVAATYQFDEIWIGPVHVSRTQSNWTVIGPSLDLTFAVGRRAWPGHALRCVPTTLARQPAWAAAIDVAARALMPGVRTRGTAGNGRREWYGAMDLHRIVTASVRFGDADLGPLRPVDPPVRFGFGSTPRAPSLVRVATTVELTA
jgi:hypothetical protein